MKQSAIVLVAALTVISSGAGPLVLKNQHRGMLPTTTAAAAESPSENASPLPPLVVDKDSPLLLDDPGRSDGSAVEGADNQACFVCHANYEVEPFAVSHAQEEVGCVDCHGDSFAHRNDENNTTPPEKMYPIKSIDAACRECHARHEAAARDVVARWRERAAAKMVTSEGVCTDCHGEHRLKLRTVTWDKETGQLLSADAKVPLNTEIPEEVLAGTPPEVLVMLFPGLRKPPEKKHEMKVPAGTVNLALKKKVTSSDAFPVLGELSFVNDGKKAGSEDCYVELGPQRQWVQIDLEKPAEIFAIYLWHYFREARSYHDVIVQVADDSTFTKNVKTLYSNDQDNSSKMGVGRARPYIDTNYGHLIDAKGVKARFVRLYSRGNTANDLNHYVEVEVFGKPAQSLTP